jgi:hypothetical protein
MIFCLCETWATEFDGSNINQFQRFDLTMVPAKRERVTGHAKGGMLIGIPKAISRMMEVRMINEGAAICVINVKKDSSLLIIFVYTNPVDSLD